MESINKGNKISPIKASQDDIDFQSISEMYHKLVALAFSLSPKTLEKHKDLRDYAEKELLR